MDYIQTNYATNVVNNDAQIFNGIKGSGDKKAQLKKVANEFESMFITKMLSLMDKTVDKEGGIFGADSKYENTFKSFVFQEVGRNLASNEHTSFGFAKQIYQQMERYVN